MKLLFALVIALFATPALAQPLPLCGSGARSSCVVDGDTLWLTGVKIRIEDIDAPEIGGAQCVAEMERGVRAAARLAEIVGSGPVTLVPAGDRDRDQYGRLLRRVQVGGESVGERLIAERLARRWSGRREGWCGQP